MFIDTRQNAAIASAPPSPPQGQFWLDTASLAPMLWRARRAIVISIVACVIAALAVGRLVPARYTAVAQVLIDPNDLRVVDNGLRGQNQLTETHVTQVENQVRVLMSNNVAKRVVERFSLERDPEFSNARVLDVTGFVRGLLGARSAAGDPVLDAMMALKKRISAKRLDRTYVVDVSVWAYDPQKAVQLADALLDAFMEEQSAARGDATRRAANTLNARLAELRERVQQAEQRVEEYKKANRIISSSGTLVNERQVTELNSQLVLARTRSAEAKSRYDRIQEIRRNRTDPGAIGEAVGSATITALRTQLAEILRKEGEVNATLGKRHPAVIEIGSQASRIRRLIDEEVARIGEAARNDMERAIAEETTLAANLERLKAGLEDTNEASVRLRELERDVQASRTVYEAYLVRTREVTEQEQLDTTNVRVIAPPEPPESRSFPPRNLVLLAGGIALGGVLGICFAFLSEWRNRRAPAVAAPAPAPTSAATAGNSDAPPPVASVAPAPFVASSAGLAPAASATQPAPSTAPPALRPSAAATMPAPGGASTAERDRRPHDDLYRGMAATQLRSKPAFRL
jgi:uncharacterized protein involved in exopolysaccharide biosynthesis